uniref:60S ribosomal protein L5-like n=1 Tax=Dermatophagoides pteronyssinus TaxID=6956 RepID=A0A6P6YKK4_DERPT|nr:60S ribosomal protein L5-like [Dermatophagoides pteronyssinus]
MVLVTVRKTPAYFSRYQVKKRRRREGKTDYQQRTRLVKQDLDKYQAKKYRFVVRFTNNRVLCQVAYSTIMGDVMMCSADSTELVGFGMPGKVRADGELYSVDDEDLERRPFTAVLDVGLVRTTTGARVFGALKGALDGGLSIPHSEKRFPGYSKDESGEGSYDSAAHRDRIFGKHVANYMQLLEQEDSEKYAKLFSRYIAAGINAANLEEKYRALHDAIRSNPLKAEKKPAVVYKYERDNHHICKDIKAANGR